jgi:hypothetical protein
MLAHPSPDRGLREFISEGVEAGVPRIVRETVEAVARLLEESGEEHVTMKKVGEELNLD